MGIYQACDIRGVFGKDLSREEAGRISRALGFILTGKTVVVGGDYRLSTPELMSILVQGLWESGCEILNIGQVATPVFYYALKQSQAQAGVMITASHNPAEYNGFKLVLGNMPVTESDIQQIAGLAAKNIRLPLQPGVVRDYPVIDNYLDFSAKMGQAGDLHIVVDAGNGATSLIAPRLYRKLGYRVTELFCQPDGNFPNRPPNPALAPNLRQLGAKVVAVGADFGIAFDGDGDRAGFVDEHGRALDNDDIMVVLAKHYLHKQQGTVIYDAKCSMVVPEEIKKAGGRAIMARAGHTFSKAAFINENAVFAGEISGHFFFRELGYDDGMFAGVMVAQAIAEQGSLAEMADAIPNYYLTPDIRVSYLHADKEQVIELVAQKLAAYPVNRIDGVRVEFSDGWGMIRSSVTEPLFTLRFEAKTRPRIREISAILIAALPEDLQKAVQAELDNYLAGFEKSVQK